MYQTFFVGKDLIRISCEFIWNARGLTGHIESEEFKRKIWCKIWRYFQLSLIKKLQPSFCSELLSDYSQREHSCWKSAQYLEWLGDFSEQLDLVFTCKLALCTCVTNQIVAWRGKTTVNVSVDVNVDVKWLHSAIFTLTLAK